MTIEVGDRVRVVGRIGYTFDVELVGRTLTVTSTRPGVAGVSVDFPHGRNRDGSFEYEPGTEWSFNLDELALVEPYEQPNTPARVRAQHAAERLVGRMTGCAANAVRALHREAYRAAYRAFRACQRGSTP